MSSGRKAQMVVGVSKRHSAVVVETAIDVARHFDAELVCAAVNEQRHAVGESADGTVTSMSFNPDVVDKSEEAFDSGLKSTLDRIFEGSGVDWSVRALAGDPAHAISHLADAIDATMIIVGTHEESIRGSLHEFFSGSVAVHLAHQQRRPVIVVPLAPVPFGHALDWDHD